MFNSYCLVTWHRSMSTLVQAMVCCLTAPSHYLNQCWLMSAWQHQAITWINVDLWAKSSNTHLRALLSQDRKILNNNVRLNIAFFLIEPKSPRCLWAESAGSMVLKTRAIINIIVLGRLGNNIQHMLFSCCLIKNGNSRQKYVDNKLRFVLPNSLERQLTVVEWFSACVLEGCF